MYITLNLMFYRQHRNCCFFWVFTASNCHFAFRKLFNKQFINLYKVQLGIQLSSAMIIALSSTAAAVNRDVPSALLPRLVRQVSAVFLFFLLHGSACTRGMRAWRGRGGTAATVISGHSSVGNDLGAKLLVTVMTCRSLQRGARWQRARACRTGRLSFNELLRISPGSLSYASLTNTDSFIRLMHVCHT